MQTDVTVNDIPNTSIKTEPEDLDMLVTGVINMDADEQTCLKDEPNVIRNDEEPDYGHCAALLVETVINEDELARLRAAVAAGTREEMGRVFTELQEHSNMDLHKMEDDAHVTAMGLREPILGTLESQGKETNTSEIQNQSTAEKMKNKSNIRQSERTRTKSSKAANKMRNDDDDDDDDGGKEARLNPIIRDKDGRLTYECRFCEKTYDNLKAFKAHSYDHHKGEHICPVCHSRFSRNSNLKVHMRRHVGEKPFACHHCPSKFSARGDLTRHLVLHGGEKSFKCTKCSNTFYKKAHLDDHMLSHRTEKPCKCPVCGASYTKKNSLKFHMRRHVGEKQFGCTLCRARFWGKFDLKRHIGTHRKERTWECTLCDETFGDEHRVEVHECQGSKSKTHEFQCSECGSRFKEKKNLMSHVKKHSEERRHKCPHCEARFWTKYDLNRHLNCHSIDKLYECTKCRSCFKLQFGLSNHLKKCIGDVSSSVTND